MLKRLNSKRPSLLNFKDYSRSQSSLKFELATTKHPLKASINKSAKSKVTSLLCNLMRKIYKMKNGVSQSSSRMKSYDCRDLTSRTSFATPKCVKTWPTKGAWRKRLRTGLKRKSQQSSNWRRAGPDFALWETKWLTIRELSIRKKLIFYRQLGSSKSSTLDYRILLMGSDQQKGPLNTLTEKSHCKP